MTEAIQNYVSTYQKPEMYKLISEGKLSKEYFRASLMSSTYIVEHINNNFNKLKNKENNMSKLDFKFASNNPTNLVNKANAFELKVLEKFRNTGLKTFTEVVQHKGKDTVFYAHPVQRNTQKCLQCHGKVEDAPKGMRAIYGELNGYKEKLGDIRAINAVYATIDVNDTMLKTYITMNLFSLCVFILIYFTLCYFVTEMSKKDKLITKQSRFAALGEMISMIAHQWRQPLTGMGMSINNLLLDIELGDSNDKNSKETLELINRQILYLSTTIDDFKNFFRPDLKNEMMNVKATIKDSILIIDSTIKSNGVEIILDIEKEIVLLTKKNDVIQIILNLIKNSMDAFIENKVQKRIINISVNETKKFINIIVKDNAGGIPAEIVEKIFDPYFSTKDKKNGTGLGLYMSKMIVEDHLSGYLNVKTKENTTIFTIKLRKKVI
ncbi:Putative two-component sensor histidine kinase [hydrothermal vent metagenome]|uniref:Putative two-component sensor histidine kinase n=1 Tax=hydrothermal vent metagenome TaxID=652676 RepID=A0A1W1CN81_9ZZZZ